MDKNTKNKADQSALSNRRGFLQSTTALLGIGVTSALGSANAVAKPTPSHVRTAELNVADHDQLDRAAVEFYSNDTYKVAVAGSITDKQTSDNGVNYSVSVGPAQEAENAKASLDEVSTQSSSNHSRGASESGEEINTEGFSTMHHGNKDNGTDFQGGAIVNTKPNAGFTNKCETKQFATWRQSSNNVNWINRYWCAWSDFNWEIMARGFADLSWPGNECHTKAFGDYRRIDNNTKVYHRITLKCEPDGQMRYITEHFVRDGGGFGYSHNAALRYKDNRENC